MTRNEGNMDRFIRIIAGAVLIALLFIGTTSGVLGIVLAIAGGVLLLTGMVGFCPLYRLLGLNTCPVKP